MESNGIAYSALAHDTKLNGLARVHRTRPGIIIGIAVAVGTSLLLFVLFMIRPRYVLSI